MTTTPQAPYPVFDPTGKVAIWLDNGGIRVWRNIDMSSAGLGSLAFTPASGHEAAPSWRHKFVEQTEDPSRVTFYRRMGTQTAFHSLANPGAFVTLKTEWSDTPAGWRAADVALGNLYSQIETEWDAPIGHVQHAYSLERLTWETRETREDGRPLGVHFTINIIEWSCITPANPSESAYAEAQAIGR